MFGEKAQTLSRKFEPLKTLLDLAAYVGGGFALVGITGAAMLTWFSDAADVVWTTTGLFGPMILILVTCAILAIVLRLFLGMFNTWRGALGLVLIAAAIVFFIAGAFLLLRDLKTATVTPSEATVSSKATKNQDSISPIRPTFDASSDGKISAKNFEGPSGIPGFAKAETGGQIILDGSRIAAQPASSNIEYPPPDGTYSSLTNTQLSEKLLQSAKLIRAASDRAEWATLAMDARELCSEALPRTGTVASAGNGSFLLLTLYVREKDAADAVATFLETMATAVREKQK